MKRLLLLGSLALMLLQAQPANFVFYTVRKQTNLTGAAEVVTVQQPGSGTSRRVQFVSAYFDCSVACNVTLERNGTAASSTSLTVNNLNPGDPLPTTVAFSGSNVGTGTVEASYSCASACQPGIPIDLSRMSFGIGSSGTTNLTLRTSSITGLVNIDILYAEAQ